MLYELWISCLIFSFFSAISPGTGTVLSLGHSLNYGWKKTSITILGQEFSLALIILFFTTSINVIFTSYKYILLVIKIIGFIWLLFLSYIQWYSNINKKYLKKRRKYTKKMPIKRFMAGFLINLSNPKAIILIATIVPQFINYNIFIYKQIYIIISTIIIIDSFIMHLYAILIYKLKKKFSNNIVFKYQNKIISIMFLIISFTILL